MMTTDWLYSDYLRPLPPQRPSLPWPDFPGRSARHSIDAEEYAALLKRLEGTVPALR